MSRAKFFFKNFFQNRKKNEKKKTNKSNQSSNDNDRKNKIQKTIFSWKNRVSLNEYFENRNEYRQNKYDKNRDEYQNRYDKNRDYNKKRYKDKYREKIRNYERFDVKFQNAKFQKTYTNSYEYENLYANDESYEKINFNEKYNDENLKNQYFYNMIMKFSKFAKNAMFSKKNLNSIICFMHTFVIAKWIFLNQ